MDYEIITDGSCDLSQEITKEKGIIVVPFYVSFDDQVYQKEMIEIGVREFYEKMVSNPGVYPKSSMPSVQDYVEAFLPVVKEKKAVLCICITTKFSGSMQSALSAKEIVLEDFPDAVITVIDATVNTVLQGLYVLEAVNMKEQGMEYEKAIERLEEIKSTGRIFFTVGNLEYLQHGGRIGKVAGIAGTLLGIRPLITLKEGEIFASGIARNRKKSMEKVIELLKNYLRECALALSKYSLTVGYGYDYEEACLFRDMVAAGLKEEFGSIEISIFQIGATIGVHTGPYPIGVGIIQKAI